LFQPYLIDATPLQPFFQILLLFHVFLKKVWWPGPVNAPPFPQSGSQTFLAHPSSVLIDTPFEKAII
jgi:hypothetical protein